MKRIRLTILVLSIFVLSFCVSCNDSGNLNVDFIDVGKGDCIILSTGRENVMIDTGYSYTTDKVSEYLKEKNITTINKLIITHFDKDHVGGASYMIDNYNVEMVYMPNYEGSSEEYYNMVTSLNSGKAKYEYVTEDVSFECDNIQFNIYPSGVEYKKNENDMSLVTTVENGEDSFIFAGDLQKKGLKKLVNRLVDDEQFDVIKMPHHGEYDSKVKDLIKKVSPEAVVITDSSDNPFSNKLRDYLQKKDIDIYSLAEHGDISIISDSSGKIRFICEK